MSDAREPAVSGRRSERRGSASDAREPAVSGRRSERRGSARGRATVIQLGTAAVALGAWEAIGRSAVVPNNVLPPMSAVVWSLVRLLGSPTIWFDFEVTAWEIGLGLLVGMGAGLVLGVVVGVRDAAWRTVEPLLYYLGALPKIILLPVLVLFLGAGVFSKVGMAALSAVFPVIVTTAVGVREVREIHVRAARTLGAGFPQIVLKVFLPATIGPVLAGVRLGLGVAVVGALLAETSVASAGIGFRAMSYYATLQIQDMYALLLVVFLAAVALNALLGSLLRQVTRHAQAAPTEVVF
ncbi:MAG: ABC transporter permease [Streptosporangiaceae bacterium]